MNKKKYVTCGKEPSYSPHYKENSSQTEQLLCKAFSINSPFENVPLLHTAEALSSLRFTHLSPLPLVFSAAISIQLDPLCHSLRIHRFEHQSQAYSQGTFFSVSL